ncbi:response regulator [Zobellia alginiliquefaciens]|uniref:response regulator n=1 Tax=Zobellia alginiliquefaciens TaxID=3032586 RepID=UPI0023E477C0|nr:response regulator [Zobellia alginiliquefaciens]
MTSTLGGKRGLSVYLADDDVTDREAFAEALNEIDRDIRLTTFQNGVEVVDRIRSEKFIPDIIVLDLYMPKMDGEECLIALRKKSKLKNVPIVLYSSEFDIDRIEKLFELGANRYLIKTSSYESLVSSLERIVESLLHKNAAEGTLHIA